MSLLHNHYSSTGQHANDLLANMFITELPPDHQHSKPPPPRRTSNSHKLIRSYDHSPPTSPSMSRRNSTSSISSTKSEPTWESQINRGRQASTASTKTNESGKSLKSFFKKDKSEKEKKQKNVDQIVLTSRHAAAVKTKMMLDPKYREIMKHHKDGAQSKTANVRGTEHSAHLTAAEQEMRHPHSGVPATHSSLDMPALTRIVSGDEDDPETDDYVRGRREWTSMHFPELAKVNEALGSSGYTPPASAPVTPQGGTPIASREGSPNRVSINGLRPIAPKAKHSWGGGYHRDETGRWTKKHDGTASPIPRSHPPPNPEVLADSIAEKLHMERSR